MRKHLTKIILFSILIFIVGISNVKAMCGDLVYDVLDMKITDKKIIIDGWAFIHQTQNGFNLSGNNTNQKIKINLCNAEETKCYYVAGEGEVDGSGFNFTEVMEYNNQLEYYYRNIGFEATFDTEKIASVFNAEGEQRLHFTISVTNDDYNSRHSSCNGTEIFNNMVRTTKKYENGKYWVKENLKILKNTINNSGGNNELIEIKATGTDQILYTGWHTYSGKKDNTAIHIGWGQIYKYEGKSNQPKYSKNSSDTAPGTYKITAKLTNDKFFSLSDVGWRYYTCANYDANGYANNDYLNIREYQQGVGNGTLGFCKSVNNNLQCSGGNVINPITSNSYSCGETRTFEKAITYAKIYGDTSITIKVKNDKKCAVSEPASNKKMNCNEWKNLSSTCEELTVRNNNSSAVVKIEQNGYISNIFKSNLVNDNNEYNANSYDGGWFKYGIVYRNELSWNIVSGNNDSNITEVMQDKIKELGTFIDNLTMNIEGLTDLSGTQLIKKCTESGEFIKGNKLITTCTFFLPQSEFKNSNGQVSYSSDENLANINNKYYIPLNEKEHSIKVTLENLSRLKDDKVKEDSQNKPWTGTWTIETSCSLKVTNRLYEPSGGKTENGKVKYKFIYRPINLSNPFPNRFPGVNWYTWYITEGNKDKKTLEDSYKKLEYYTELDNRTISTIKEYNKNHNYFSKVDTDFFGDYIKEGGNS